MHEKDFDSWNEHKKYINTVKLKLYRAREIWWSTLGLNIGFEQDGAGETYRRPVLILKGISREIAIVVPITSSEKENKYRLSIGVINDIHCFAILSQIRALDTRRLYNKMTVLNKETFEEIRNAAKDLL